MLSAASEAVVLKTDGEPIIPVAPASVTASASEFAIDVIWEAVQDAQSYRVAVATDAVERVVADEVEDTSYTVAGLAPGTTYTVKVYAIRRGNASAAAEQEVPTIGARSSSDNWLHNKEVQFSRVWNDSTSSYGAQKALDNDLSDGSRWVSLKGSTSAWMMADIGREVPVSELAYYSYQNRLMKLCDGRRSFPGPRQRSMDASGNMEPPKSIRCGGGSSSHSVFWGVFMYLGGFLGT